MGTISPEELLALTEQVTAPEDDQASKIGALAQRQVELEDALARLKEQEKLLNEELRSISSHDLPNALADARMSGLTMEDGSSVTVSEVVRATIPAKNRERAHGWLRQNGFDDLIKNTISVAFGAGEDQDAGRAGDMLAAEGFDVESQERVHPSTLSAFVREQLQNLDADTKSLLGVFESRVTKITRPKA